MLEWEQIATRAFVSLRCPPGDQIFDGRLRQVNTSSASLSWIATDAIQIERTAESAVAYDGDSLLLTIQLDANSAVEQGGRTATLDAGSAAWYDPRRPYILDFPEPNQRISVIKVDRRDLPLTDAEVDGLIARRISPQTAGMSALRGLLDGVKDDAPDTASRVDASLLRLLNRVAESVLESGSMGGSEAILLSEIRGWASQHLNEPNLRIAVLARNFHLSERAIYALFERAGNSPGGWIRQQRSLRAERLLVTTDRPVADVGVACGYLDAASFTRFFRGMTGTTPTAYRERARRNLDRVSTLPDPVATRVEDHSQQSSRTKDEDGSATS